MGLLGVTDLRVSFRYGMASSGPYGARWVEPGPGRSGQRL